MESTSYSDIEISQAWLTLIYNDLHRGTIEGKEEETILPASFPLIERICQCNTHHMNLIVAMLAETRDKYNGKGEVAATYCLADACLDIDEPRTIQAIFWICQHLGSFKDLKRWCHHLYKKNYSRYAYTIEHIVHKMNDQLYLDTCMIDPADRTNIAKWIPRERSKYGGWLYDMLVIDWCKKTRPTYMFQNIDRGTMKTFCKEYRQILSKMHREEEIIDYKVPYTMEQLVDMAYNEILYPCTIDLVKAEKEWTIHQDNCVGTRQAKNALLFLVPSSNRHHFKKQVATLCQAMMYTGKRRFVLLKEGVPVMVQYTQDNTWQEVVQDIWSYKKTTESSDTH